MPGRVFAVRFSPDGTRVIAGSSKEGTGEVRIYQAANGQLVSKLESQKGPVYAVAYRRDGKVVASAGFDGVVRLSDPQTGKLIKEFIPVPLQPKTAKTGNPK
jgi:WD40 repeat protein